MESGLGVGIMKRMRIALLALLLIVLLIAAGYVIYVFADYSRIEDHQALSVAQHGADPMPVGQPQRIVSWNIGFGAYNADYSFFMDGGTESRAYSKEICESNIQSVIETLRAQAADFMLLQEVDIRGTRSYHVDQAAMIEGAFQESHSAVFAQNYDSSYLFYPFHQPIGANQSGILTLADAQIDGAIRISLPIEGGFRKFLDLDRCYSVSRIPTENGKLLCLYNLHLSAYTSDGSIATRQLEMMLEDMRADYADGNYVIAGGDFNKDLYGDSGAYTGISGKDESWRQPFPQDALPDEIRLVDSLNPENLLFSCRDTSAPYEKGKSFVVTLDGFLISENVQLLSCEVIDTGFAVTDHNPVCMDFVLM